MENFIEKVLKLILGLILLPFFLIFCLLCVFSVVSDSDNWDDEYNR